MTKLYKSLIAIALSFMCAFVAIGYAAVTTELAINGTATIAAPDGVIITKVELVSGDGSNIGYSGDVLSSTVNLPSGDTVVLKVTMQNFTGEKVFYDQAIASGEYYDNANIGYTTSLVRPYKDENGAVITNGTSSIAASDTIEFTMTFSYNDETVELPEGIDPAVLNSQIQILFKPLNEININSTTSPETISGALDAFLDILNKKDENGNKTKYEALREEMSQHGTGENSWDTGPYAGTVAGSQNDIVKQLFGEDNLTVIINSTPTPISVMVKNINIDGNADTGIQYDRGDGSWWNPEVVTEQGGEMVLFMTSEKELYEEVETEGWFGSTSISKESINIVVYAVVFTTIDGGDTWFQISDMYVGTADTNEYDNDVSTEPDSFDTGSWRSSADAHTVAGGYTYNVTANQELSTIMSQTANANNLTPTANALTVLKNLVTEAENIATNRIPLGTAEAPEDTLYAKAYWNAKAIVGLGDANIKFAQAVAMINALEPQVAQYRTTTTTE